VRGVAGRIKAIFTQSTRQSGQVIILLVFAFIALLAMVGIVIDGAMVYVQYDHLRRAVDAAAVAATNQYREGRDAIDLHNAVVETIHLQLPDAQNIKFHWCQSDADITDMPYDPQEDTLCTDPPRKRVRVEAELPVDLVFISLVWSNQVILRNEAEAEAAVLNMVLLLDTSESMAYGGCSSTGEEELYQCLVECTTGDPGRCSVYPWWESGEACCVPFDSEPGVRWAAYEFVDTLMRKDVDRVAVYHLDKTPVITESVEHITCFVPDTREITVTIPGGQTGGVVPLTTDKDTVLEAIEDPDLLSVYRRLPACDDDTGECCTSPVQVGGYWGEENADCVPPESCGYGYRWANTNIGGGMREAVAELVANGTTDAAVWVIVLLSDGAANATDIAADDNGWWTCPSPDGSGGPNYRDRRLVPAGPFCRDPEYSGAVTRHCPSQAVCDRDWYTNPGDVYDEWQYDADDYARDIADLASSQAIAVYTVGFGPKVISESRGRPDAGEQLLRYIADVGDDGDLETDPCNSADYWDLDTNPLNMGEDCGNYYFAQTASDLEDVFESIASRIFSRITQ
jgi:hypothetical protein